jgi:hypothetical protein
VESLTGIPAFDWALAQLYAVAGTLVVGSLWWRSAGSRVYRVLVVPFVAGAAGGVTLVTLLPSETWNFLGQVHDRPAAVAFAVAVVFVGIAIADFLVVRAAPLVARAVHGRDAQAGDVVLALTLFLPAVLALAGIMRLDERTESGYERSQARTGGPMTVLAEYELPGQPMDLVFRNESEGYVSFEDGRIARFVLESGSELEFTAVATGLRSPRGIAIVGDALIVAELGTLPCEQSFPCKGENVGASSLEEGERKILYASRGRLSRFDIRTDGTLANRRVILGDLPVANSDHGVNAVMAGEAGRVYVSIGNVDRLFAASFTDAERARPHFDLLGTVVSLRPDGRDLRVVASGLRNVYDLALDDVGRVYGVDNDGATMRGWRQEEVLEIRMGGHYGYPYDGTFGPYTHRTVPPLWVLDTVGSAGIEWVRWDGRSMLIVGSCDDVYAVGLSDAGSAVTVNERFATEHLLSVPGCVTAVERVAAGRIAMTLFTFGGPPRLYLVELEP